jgi:hypothetical protein
MKKLLSVAIAAAFAASSFGVLAQDKKDVKSGGSNVTTPAKDSVTTGGGKPKKDASGSASIPKPKHQGKRKNEKERMEQKK